MEASSQKGRRAPRPWTAQEQVTAEVAAACGVSLAEISKALGRTHSVIRHRLIPVTAVAQRQQIRNWRANNKNRIKESNRAYRAANRDAIGRYMAAYRQKNPDIVAKHQRVWRQRNPGKAAKCVKQWQARNPARSCEYARRRRAIKRARSFMPVQPVTLQDKEQRFLLWRGFCAYCGAAGKMTVDHVLPLNGGGADEYDNIAPACLRCNCSKQDRPVETWYRSQPFFTEARWAKIQRHCPAAVTGQLPLAFGPTP